MIEPLLQAQLDPVARRTRRLRLWKAMGWYWLFAAFGGTALLILSGLLQTPVWVGLPAILSAGVIGSGVVRRRAGAWNLDYQQIAREIEQKHPELHALLLTAVEQTPDPATGRLSYLQERVIQQAIDESRKHKWIDSVSPTQLTRAELFNVAALAAFVFAMVLTPGIIPRRGSLFTASTLGKVHVTPGDTTLERGSGLVILARFDGRVPADATLVMKPAGGEVARIPLVKNLDDPTFGGTIPEVQFEFLYTIEHDGKSTRDYKVSVFELPRLEKADAHLVYPEYTGLPEKTISDTRRVTAVEGSKVDLTLRLNKPVTSARLVAKDKTTVALAIQTNTPVVTLDDFVLEASKNYELQLRDADGRTNRIPAQFVFDAQKNRRPDLKLAAPRGDQRVSSLEEMQFAVEAWDDYGVKAIGLDYMIPGKERKTTVLTPETLGKDKLQLAHLIRLEELDVVPDQLVSYYLWAEDVGPDGAVRRTSGDMFFAEIRPFEEIYRENESGAGGEQQHQQGGGGEALKLAELQKQIINATWKLHRQEQGAGPSPQYKKDHKVILESQQKARQQAELMRMRANDPRTQLTLQSVEEDMNEAIADLKAAADSTEALLSAVNAEQSAYQSLLKLASREYMVSRQQRQRSQGGEVGGQRNQQQLDQLELKQEENRYETQRQASRREKPEQKEQLAFLNRLKELAQRQQDMNERIRELQSALQEAKTEAEKEELRRQLKRLREEEREMLADMDELKQDMDRPGNQSRMAEDRQQLERTRSEVQRAAEALENNNPSRALASGARAQQELEKMRDDIRKRNSSEFAEEMREMRQEARELAQQQNEIGQKLQESTENQRKTLAGTPETKDLIEKLQAQKSALTNLFEHMRSVSEKAGSSEPLLSKQLYDTFRKSSQANTENSLALSEELLRRSFVNEARDFESRARKDVQELKRGVEQAAESVLGDEAEALKTARGELEELTRLLKNEMAQASRPGGTNGTAGASSTNAPVGEQGAERKAEQAPALSGEQQSSQQPDGKNRGEQQSGGGQNGSQRQPGSNSEQANAERQNGAQQQPGGGRQQQQANAEGDNSSGRQQAGNGRGGNRRDLQNFFNQGGERDELGGNGDPLTGEHYREFSERLSNLEEMLDAPELRSEVTRIRDRVRNTRAEFKRHAKDPQWDLVKTQILNPMTELRDRIHQELLKHESQEALVPIDRDPVPSKFSELVRRYYEQLGKADSAPYPRDE